ncbi:MAG: deoxyhypusine synthase family protein [Polyangiaceae bacterium]|nr:deoxyhypusine synthase family protein [Polyangiaceae bacterium]
MGKVRDFITHHYRHFNAAFLVDAASGWDEHVRAGGKMMLTLGGAMSTAELGLSIAELIRRDKVHALSVTGANLEEDLFNLVAHDSYRRIPNFREITPEQDRQLMEQGLSRVTDTCIPEEEAMRKIEGKMLAVWQRAEAEGQRHTPAEYVYQLLRSRELEPEYDIDPKDCWLVAACERNVPIFTPGWEDSTLGNMFTAAVMDGRLKSFATVKSGTEQLAALIDWYRRNDRESRLGFFQVGGGISGDFAISVVPLIELDLQEQVRKWGYFCQISEARTSYGSYSGAPPSEKITWGKLDVDTPRHMIESDATIVFPLIAAYVLDY